MMKQRTRLVWLALSGLVAIGVAPPQACAVDARLRRLVVVGDSVFAGFSSGGFVGRGRAGQVDSAPAFVARRAGVSLPQPLLSSPGVPPQLAINDANGSGQLDAGEVRRNTGSIGTRARPIRGVRNLAVPGEDTQSVFDEISPGVIARKLFTGDTVDGRDVIKFLVLGVPPRSDSISQVTRARDLRPSFLMVWLGNNDVLGMATGTSPDAVTLNPAQFGRRFSRLLDALADTHAGMAVANLPDVTGIAALRRAAGEVTLCRQSDGALRPVAADDLLSIDLPRSELPTPACTEVLGPTERDLVRAKIVAFNAEIAAGIAETEQRRGVAIASVDTFALFDRLRQQGVDIDGNGTVDLTTGYLGGIFSLDGIHPTRTGNALIANAFIDAINQRFGDAIPAVNVARVALGDPLVDNGFRPAGEVPFGVIGPDDGNDLQDFFVKVADQVSRGARDFRGDVGGSGRDPFDRLKRFFKDLF
jgi:lysophospholipase L1-like esterase